MGVWKGKLQKTNNSKKKKQKGNKVNCFNIALVEYVSTFFDKIFGLK